MARPKGTPKSGGRKKGTPNKRSAVLTEVLDELGLDVPAEIVKCLKKKYQGSQHFVIGTSERVQILLDLMNYIFPKRKAIELDAKAGGPLDAYLRMTPEERASRRADLEKRLGKKQ